MQSVGTVGSVYRDVINYQCSVNLVRYVVDHATEEDPLWMKFYLRQ